MSLIKFKETLVQHKECVCDYLTRLKMKKKYSYFNQTMADYIIHVCSTLCSFELSIII